MFSNALVCQVEFSKLSIKVMLQKKTVQKKKKLILSCKTAQSAWSKSIFMHISHWHSNCSEWNFSVVTHGKPFCVNVWALIIVPVVCWCWHVWFWKEWFSERMVNSTSVAPFSPLFAPLALEIRKLQFPTSTVQSSLGLVAVSQWCFLLYLRCAAAGIWVPSCWCCTKSCSLICLFRGKGFPRKMGFPYIVYLNY